MIQSNFVKQKMSSYHKFKQVKQNREPSLNN